MMWRRTLMVMMMAKLFRNPEAERRIQQRLFATIANKHDKRIKRELRRQYSAAADAFESNRSVDSAVRQLEGKLENDIVALMQAAYKEIGGRVRKALREATGKSWKRVEEMDPVFERAMRAYVAKYSGQKVTQVTKATQKQVSQIVRRGIEEGLTNREIAALIQKDGKIYSAYRSKMIARTESHSAANAASQGQAKESGVVKRKEWIAAFDDRTRAGDNSDFDHTDVESVRIEKPFNVSGEELEHPGDPAGSAGNIIMCRCAMGYEV